MKTIVVIIALVVGLISLSIAGNILGWFGGAAQVAQEEFSPKAMLSKYEWFKDAAAQLDKKQSDIMVYSSRIDSQDSAYAGVPRREWPRDEREQRSVWESEVAGVKASYNMLAAEYNSAMAKFNWSFANAGQLPQGASQPLPREFKPYAVQ